MDNHNRDNPVALSLRDGARSGACWYNASTHLARHPDHIYCEGFVRVAGDVFIAHAWVKEPDGAILEVTPGFGVSPEYVEMFSMTFSEMRNKHFDRATSGQPIYFEGDDRYTTFTRVPRESGPEFVPTGVYPPDPPQWTEDHKTWARRLWEICVAHAAKVTESEANFDITWDTPGPYAIRTDWDDLEDSRRRMWADFRGVTDAACIEAIVKLYFVESGPGRLEIFVDGDHARELEMDFNDMIDLSDDWNLPVLLANGPDDVELFRPDVWMQALFPVEIWDEVEAFCTADDAAQSADAWGI